MDASNPYPVAVIGAGPVGLAAAAHLLERGLEPLVFEAGARVGASIREWGHVRVFSPWEFDIDPASRRLLERAGWEAPPADGYPTGAEIVERYLEPLAALPEIAGRLRLGARVTAVTKAGVDKLKDAGRDAAPFELVVEQYGEEHRHLAAAVIDASGTWTNANPVGAGGLPAAGERLAGERISHGIPDVLGARPRPLRREAGTGRGQRPLGLQRDPRPRHPARVGAGDRDRLGDPRRRPGPHVWRRRRRRSCRHAVPSARRCARSSTTVRSSS